MNKTICARVVFLCVILASLTLAQYPQMDFPLQIGNRWQYSEIPGNYSESRVVRDTIMLNGLTYAQVQGELFGGFYRKDGARIFSYNPSSNYETLAYDFSKKRGDTLYIQVNNTDTVVKTVYGDGVGMSYGQQRHGMSFLTKHSTTMYGIEAVTDGIGFSGYSGEVFYFYLAGAIINGVQYGVVLQVHNSENVSPNEYHIFQNYPNPFNPETTISFTVSNSDYVSILIYDQLGKHVTTLLSRNVLAGSHSIKWRAQNMPSGVYYYRVQIGKNIESKRMVLSK